MPRDASVTRAEREARRRVEALGIDVDAWAAVSNVFRVANAIRNYTERDFRSLGTYTRADLARVAAEPDAL